MNPMDLQKFPTLMERFIEETIKMEIRRITDLSNIKMALFSKVFLILGKRKEGGPTPSQTDRF